MPNKRVSKEVKKYVKNVMDADVEDKVYTTNQLNAAAGPVDYNLGTLQNLSGMAQGLTNITRIGNKIRPKSLELWGSAYAATAALASNSLVRFIIFQRNDMDPTAPTSADLLVAASLSTGNAPLSAYDAGTVPRKYKILFSTILNVSGLGEGVASFHKKITGKKLSMITFATNAATNGKGSIWSLIMSNQIAAAATCPAAGIVSRLVYEDA